MRQRLPNLAAACSAVLCLTTVLLWLRSYTFADAVGYAGRYRAAEVSFVNGRLHVWHWATSDPTWAAMAWWPGWRYMAAGPTNSWAYRLPGGNVTFSFTLAGTNYSLRRGASADIIRYFHTPAWLLVLTTALFPAWWAYRRRRGRIARALEQGLCPLCGYDLRASAERCPECGAITEPAKTAA